ncbi:MFS transporter [Corynebacterium bovis]|uniref:MFS transporter n=2 Tax=Corynebacterium bovis TaxID=36808 RepID=UPI003138B63D
MIFRLWPFIIGSVALGLDAYIIAGLLPLMAPDLSASEGMVGLGVTAFTGAYAVTGPVLAGAAGRNPGRSLSIALAVFTLGNLATAFTSSLAVFIIARIVAGGAAGVYSPLSSAVAAASVPEKNRGRALGLVLAGLAMGTVFGVPLGLILTKATSWRIGILLVTVVGVVALAGVFFSNSRDLPGVEAPSLGDRLRSVGTLPNLTTVSVTLLTGIASLGLYTYITSVLGDTGLRDSSTLGIWIWGLGGAVGVLLIGRLIDRVGNSLRITAVILVLLTVSLLVVGTGPAVWVLGVALFVWGATGWASLAPQQDTLLTANPHDGATAVAANASANYLGSAIGSALGAAVVAAGVSGTNLAYLAAVPVVVALGLHLLRMRLAR